MMHNMCCAKADAVAALDAASVGAFAFVGKDGRLLWWYVGRASIAIPSATAPGRPAPTA
jgi:hypothetical protein